MNTTLIPITHTKRGFSVSRKKKKKRRSNENRLPTIEEVYSKNSIRKNKKRKVSQRKLGKKKGKKKAKGNFGNQSSKDKKFTKDVFSKLTIENNRHPKPHHIAVRIPSDTPLEELSKKLTSQKEEKKEESHKLVAPTFGSNTKKPKTLPEDSNVSKNLKIEHSSLPEQKPSSIKKLRSLFTQPQITETTDPAPTSDSSDDKNDENKNMETTTSDTLRVHEDEGKKRWQTVKFGSESSVIPRIKPVTRKRPNYTGYNGATISSSYKKGKVKLKVTSYTPQINRINKKNAEMRKKRRKKRKKDSFETNLRAPQVIVSQKASYMAQRLFDKSPYKFFKDSGLIRVRSPAKSSIYRNILNKKNSKSKSRQQRKKKFFLKNKRPPPKLGPITLNSFQHMVKVYSNVKSFKRPKKRSYYMRYLGNKSKKMKSGNRRNSKIVNDIPTKLVKLQQYKFGDQNDSYKRYFKRNIVEENEEEEENEKVQVKLFSYRDHTSRGRKKKKRKKRKKREVTFFNVKNLEHDIELYKFFISTTLNRYKQRPLLMRVLNHIPERRVRRRYKKDYRKWRPETPPQSEDEEEEGEEGEEEGEGEDENEGRIENNQGNLVEESS